MEMAKNSEELNIHDRMFMEALKKGNNKICRQFFYQEIEGILHKIRVKIFHGKIDLDEMISELYLYLSINDWSKLDSFNAKSGCRLRTWMIPVAWRYFMSIRGRLLYNERTEDNINEIGCCYEHEDFRIQVAIDVNAILTMMPNQRYAEVIRLLLIEGYTTQDVADMFGVRVENVYNLKHRAITQFIELYGQR